jgi:hypothetical protein
MILYKKLDALRRAIAEVKQCRSVIGWVTTNYLKLRPSEGTLSQCRLHLQSTPTNPLGPRGMARSPYMYHKACAPEVGTLIG